MENKWCPIDIDCFSITQILQKIKLKGIQAEEIISFPNDIKADNMHALTIIFKSDLPIHVGNVIPDTKPDLYFCQQILHNAPIPQAILSVILNLEGIQLPQELLHYKEFVKDLPYNMREHTINHLQFFKAACQSYGGANNPSECLDFISFVPNKGKIYAFGSIEKCPLFVDNIKGDWVQTMQSRIAKLIEECMKSDILFHIIAFVQDKKELAEERLKKNRSILVEVKKRLGMKVDNIQSDCNEIIKCLPVETEKLEQMYKSLNEEMMQDQYIVTSEDERARLCKDEYLRKGHNYVPFIFNLLKLMAEKGKLNQAVANVKAKHL